MKVFVFFFLEKLRKCCHVISLDGMLLLGDVVLGKLDSKIQLRLGLGQLKIGISRKGWTKELLWRLYQASW